MAERNANFVQTDFPELVADIIRQLRLTGTVGLLGFSDQIVPVYIAAQREGALAIELSPVVYTSPTIFSGTASSPAAGTVIVDTGQLPVGDYDVFANLNHAGASTSDSNIALEHRNAGNSATLANLLLGAITGGAQPLTMTLQNMGYRLALDERLRIIVGGLFAGPVSGVIGAIRRPTP